MTLENISNVPQIYSGTLRIAPRALQFLNYGEGATGSSLRTFPRDPLSHQELMLLPSQILYPPMITNQSRFRAGPKKLYHVSARDRYNLCDAFSQLYLQ